MTKLAKQDIAIIARPISGRGRSVGAKVFGNMFGPCLLVVGGDLGDAFDEWDDSRFASEVDVEADRSDLADYAENLQEAIEKAMEDGDIRCTGSGRFVWVDHHEWVRDFDTVTEAGMMWRS